MKPDEIRKLLGGYATGTLTQEERRILFEAALQDQELYNELADEEPLRVYLQDPAFRRNLRDALEPAQFAWFRKPAFRAPAFLGLAATVAAGLLVFVAVRRPTRQKLEPVQMAKVHPQPPAAPAELPAAVPPARSRRAASPKRLAVIDFNSGKAAPELGESVSNLVNAQLASGGVYAVVERDQVKKATEQQEASSGKLDSAAAANIGRSVGADAVVVGNVSAPVGAARKAQAPALVAVTAHMIDSKTGKSFARVKASVGPAGDAESLKTAAASISSQLEQGVGTKQGQVTDVVDQNTTLNVGIADGIKIGDRVSIRRGQETIGHVLITAATETSATGTFSGRMPPKTGDIAVLARE
ncbi:MAG: CsgG/HfaB family protein [Acidobacteriota bacterium]|nr:CsgG/HfaB family protein [Acidobacteriota bacterium]